MQGSPNEYAYSHYDNGKNNNFEELSQVSGVIIYADPEKHDNPNEHVNSYYDDENDEDLTKVPAHIAYTSPEK